MHPAKIRISDAPRSGKECGLESIFLSTSIYIDMKTIQMTIDDRLLKAVDKMCKTLKTTRSGFIRDALEAELRRIRIREAEARHIEGYARNPVAPGEFDVWLEEQDWGSP